MPECPASAFLPVASCLSPASIFRHPVSQSGTDKLPDWVPLFRYRTGSGIGIFVHFGTGLTGTPDAGQSGIIKTLYNEKTDRFYPLAITGVRINCQPRRYGG